MKYELVDSGNQKKFEQFGAVSLVRPCSQALWRPQLPKWEGVDGNFSREEGNNWEGAIPSQWQVEHEGVLFHLSATDFGHLGVFPEHAVVWKEAASLLPEGGSVLNLFAYSGGATLALAKAGAEVCHVDASKGMVDWARKNARLNGLEDAPIRWIVDDALKFLAREVRRGRRYEGVLLDPPSFGRGAKGEVFKIERDILPLLELCKAVLSERARFLFFTTHTPGMGPLVMRHLLEDIFPSGVEASELVLESKRGRSIPMGAYAKWVG
jgi:23S rRNA (cytosine1962-C5)-methyltransferase